MGIRLFDMVGCLSSAMDLVSPEVVGHHRRVGFIVNELALVAGLPDQIRTDLALAGMIHDVGAFSLKDRLTALAFDANDRTHPETGYRLLSGFPGFQQAAGFVREHHRAWKDVPADDREGLSEQNLGNLLCLADRLDTLLPRVHGAEVDKLAVIARVCSGRDRLFNPIWVDAFEALLDGDGFLESVTAPRTQNECPVVPDACNPELRGREISKISRLFSQIIDFRCRFTATHSRGVSAIAMVLSRELGLSGEERDRLEIASELHDLGKLGVPSEIILKPASLDPEETITMQRHALHGFNVLNGTPGMDGVAELVGQHHERLDGKGYPHGLKGSRIGLTSRVLAISDVFTAMGEDRPYRPGIELGRIISILEDMAKTKSLDEDLVSLVTARKDDLDAARREAQCQALADFECFATGLAP